MITVSRMKRPLYLALVQLQAGFQENAGERLHDVGLVHDRDLLAAGRDGMLERELQQTPAALAGVDAGGHGDRVRIVVDLDVVLVADVQAFEIFAHHHQVDVVEAAAGNQRASGTQIGVQLGIPRAIAHSRIDSRRPRGSRAAPSTPGGCGGCCRGSGAAADRPRIFTPSRPASLPIPLKRRAERIEGGERRHP